MTSDAPASAQPTAAERRAKIVERCRRLRALAGSSNPHEAASAAAMLQTQLFKYNIELAEIDAADVHAQKTRFEQHRTPADNSELYWQSPLMCGIADCNNVRSALDTGERRTVGTKEHKIAIFELVGQQHNIEIVNYLYDYLTFAISEMSEVGWIVYEAIASPNRRLPAKRKHDWITDFRYGAMHEIVRRIRGAHEADLRATSATTMALIVHNDKALDDAFREIIGPFHLRSSTFRGGNTSGLDDGRAYGRKADINRSGISAASSTWGTLR